MRVAVLGASANPERYSNRAVRMLGEFGHEVLPVNPQQRGIEGLTTYARLGAVPQPLDVVTLYVNPKQGEGLIVDLLAARPRMVIFNPGTESAAMQAALTAEGIAFAEACTLVLLQTRQFDRLLGD